MAVTSAHVGCSVIRHTSVRLQNWHRTPSWQNQTHNQLFVLSVFSPRPSVHNLMCPKTGSVREDVLNVLQATRLIVVASYISVSDQSFSLVCHRLFAFCSIRPRCFGPVSTRESRLLNLLGQKSLAACWRATGLKAFVVREMKTCTRLLTDSLLTLHILTTETKLHFYVR